MSAPPIDVNAVIPPTMGALMLSMVFSSVMYGVTVLQTYQYYDGYWEDPAYMKVFVAALWVLDTAQLVTVIHSNWWYLIANYANVAALNIVPVSLAIEVGFTISIGVLVQSFFAYRVWYTSGRQFIIPLTIVCLTLATFSLGIFYAVTGQRNPVVEEIAKITWATVASLSCSMAADFLITGSLVYYLHRHRSGLRRTDKLINVLIVYTVNTGLLTSIAAMCTIILSKTLVGTQWQVIPYFLVSKFYVNSTLATLNAREKLRNMPAGMSTNGAQLELSTRPDGGSTTMVHKRNRNNHQESEIKFATVTESMADTKVLDTTIDMTSEA
ncbi:hypothetical protein CERSUDRAFT_109894 [Gelatoporia subvermispora B]|uniref:DUF6534 domain-containing protein n=1 Tax=Ceriporiopsis subvermispora (strain B) TaxID=914234 RepID=M2RQW9_CERS8|nr:hypothetical protein CERSUDRAFT_109894 [Gelatoporia subvermispora B]